MHLEGKVHIYPETLKCYCKSAGRCNTGVVTPSLASQVAARHPSRAHLLQARVVHSKLASGRWPRLETDAQLPTRVKAALASWGFASNRREASSADAGLNGEGDGRVAGRRRRRLSRGGGAWLLKTARLGVCGRTQTPNREMRKEGSLFLGYIANCCGSFAPEKVCLGFCLPLPASSTRTCK